MAESSCGPGWRVLAKLLSLFSAIACAVLLLSPISTDKGSGQEDTEVYICVYDRHSMKSCDFFASVALVTLIYQTLSLCGLLSIHSGWLGCSAPRFPTENRAACLLGLFIIPELLVFFALFSSGIVQGINMPSAHELTSFYVFGHSAYHLRMAAMGSTFLHAVTTAAFLAGLCTWSSSGINWDIEDFPWFSVPRSERPISLMSRLFQFISSLLNENDGDREAEALTDGQVGQRGPCQLGTYRFVVVTLPLVLAAVALFCNLSLTNVRDLKSNTVVSCAYNDNKHVCTLIDVTTGASFAFEGLFVMALFFFSMPCHYESNQWVFPHLDGNIYQVLALLPSGLFLLWLIVFFLSLVMWLLSDIVVTQTVSYLAITVMSTAFFSVLLWPVIACLLSGKIVLS